MKVDTSNNDVVAVLPFDQLAQEVLYDVHQSIVPHHYEYAVSAL